MGWMSDLFGDNEAFDDAQKQYESYMSKSRDYISGGYKQGRTDLTDYLEKGIGYTAPYRQAGEKALTAYEGTLGLGEDQGSAIAAFRNNPGYKFALQEGLKGVGQSAAARGMAGSGAQAKALLKYGSGLADQTYGNYQQKLAGLAQYGGQMSAQAGQDTMNTGRGLADFSKWQGEQMATNYGMLGTNASNMEMAKAKAGEQGFSDILGAGAKILGAGIGAGWFSKK